MGGVDLHAAIGGDSRPGTARFHRVGGDAGDGEIQGGEVGGSGQGSVSCIDIAALPQKADVVGHVIPNRGCAVFHGGARFGDDGQSGVVDHDGLGGFLAGGSGFGDNQGDGFADETHTVGGQQRAVGFRCRAAVWPGEANPTGDGGYVGQIGGDIDGDDSGDGARG